MPRFSLRTLMVVMLLGGPGLAVLWWGRGAFGFLAVFLLLYVGLGLVFLVGMVGVGYVMRAAIGWLERVGGWLTGRK
jgi:hypothetical protein